MFESNLCETALISLGTKKAPTKEHNKALYIHFMNEWINE